MTRLVLEGITNPDRLVAAVSRLLDRRDDDALYTTEELIFSPAAAEPYAPPVGYVRCADRGNHWSLTECWLCWNDVMHGVITERNVLAVGAQPTLAIERALLASPPYELEAATPEPSPVEQAPPAIVDATVITPIEDTPADVVAEVRARVETILREFLDVDDLVLDEDGDYPITFDGGRLGVGITATGTPHVHVYADAAHALPFSRDVAVLLNDLNRGAGHTRWFLAADGRLRGEAELFGVTLDFPELACTIYEIEGIVRDIPKLLRERLGDDDAGTGMYL